MTLVANQVAQAAIVKACRELIESGELAEALAFAKTNGIDEEWVQQTYAAWSRRQAKASEDDWGAKIRRAKERLNGVGAQIGAPQNVSGDAVSLNEAIARVEPAKAEPQPEPEPEEAQSPKAGLPAIASPPTVPVAKALTGEIILPVTAAAEEAIRILDTKHAMIGNYGGKCVVLSWEHWNVDINVMVPTFQKISDFKNRYLNRYVLKETDDGMRRVNAAEFWLEHPKRAIYDGVAFEPSETGLLLPGNRVNLWRGFAVEPKAGECGRFVNHIYEVLADGDPKGGEYIERWLAWTLQNPGRRAEAVLVLQGEEGAGKSMVADVMLKIFGPYGLPISEQKHLVGAFSGHLQHCAFLSIEEAFWAGHVEAEGRLKNLVTQETITIEPKYYTPFQVRNCLHILMSSNNDWVVPAGHGARRYAVFKVIDRYVGQIEDGGYFSKIWAELHDGGIEAIAHHLLHMDLGSWHPKQIYQTAALLDQKAHSLRGLDAWIEGMLQSGSLPAVSLPSSYSDKYPNRILSKDLLATAKRYDPYTNENVVVKKLKDIFRLKADDDFNTNVNGHSARGWKFPTLIECRKLWETRNGGRWQWHHSITEWRSSGSLLDESNFYAKR